MGKLLRILVYVFILIIFRNVRPVVLNCYKEYLQQNFGHLFFFKKRNLWCFLFYNDNVTLLQGALKKIADQPCYNVILYLRRT